MKNEPFASVESTGPQRVGQESCDSSAPACDSSTLAGACDTLESPSERVSSPLGALWLALIILPATALLASFWFVRFRTETTGTEDSAPFKTSASTHRVRGSVDLGAIVPSFRSQHFDATGRIKYAFIVKNETAKPVEFTKVQKSCGCTTATLEKKKLNPGERTTLRLLIANHETTGPVSVSCDLLTNRKKSWRYLLNAFVYSAFEMEPDSLYLGRFAMGETMRGSWFFTTRAPRGSALPQVVGATVADKRLACKISPVKTDETDKPVRSRQYRLTVSGMAGQQLGLNQARISVKYEVLGKLHEHVCYCTWKVDGPYRVTLKLLFTKVSADGTTTTVPLPVVRLSRTDGKPVPFKAVASQHRCVTVKAVPVRLPSGQAIEIRAVLYLDKDVPRFLSGTLNVKTEDSMCSEIKIPYACLVERHGSGQDDRSTPSDPKRPKAISLFRDGS